MDNAAEILVIFLSVFLAIFLALAVTLTILLIRVTRQISEIATSAQNTVDNVNQFTTNVTKFSSPALIGKFLVDQFKKSRK
jgi:hypothetical protein